MKSNGDQDQRAARKLKPLIDRNFPVGWCVAIAKGKIVADAADFDSLDAKLVSLGLDPVRTLAVQAGVNYPYKAVIFL